MHVLHTGISSFVNRPPALNKMEVTIMNNNNMDHKHKTKQGSYNFMTEKSLGLVDSTRSCHRILKKHKGVNCFPFGYTMLNFM